MTYSADRVKSLHFEWTCLRSDSLSSLSVFQCGTVLYHTSEQIQVWLDPFSRQDFLVIATNLFFDREYWRAMAGVLARRGWVEAIGCEVGRMAGFNRLWQRLQRYTCEACRYSKFFRSNGDGQVMQRTCSAAASPQRDLSEGLRIDSK